MPSPITPNKERSSSNSDESTNATACRMVRMAAGLGKNTRAFWNRSLARGTLAPTMPLSELTSGVAMTDCVDARARDRTLKLTCALVAREPCATSTSPPARSMTMFDEFWISLVAASMTRPPVKRTVLLPVGAEMSPKGTPPAKPSLPGCTLSPKAITTMVPSPGAPAPIWISLPCEKSTVLPIKTTLPAVSSDSETVR